MESRYDIVIAGGGMVGASLALAVGCALPGVRMLIVESFALPPGEGAPAFQPSFDARSTALSAGSRRIYETMGAWSQLEPGLCPIDSIHVSSRGRPGSTLMHAAAEGLPALGYVVENHWLGRVLMAQLKRRPHIEWCAPARVQGVRLEGPGDCRVEVNRDGEPYEVACELLVVADGQDSGLARALGIGYADTDYGHSAIIANVTTSKPHEGRAFERFTGQGPLALLPLLPTGGRSRSALVWTMPTALAGDLAASADGDFLEALQQRFGFRLGRLERVGERFHYPLRLLEASEQVRSGVAIMGNAAHSLHPVAGQGFNLALRDIARLVEALVAARQQGQSLGELSVLQAYLDAQRWDQRKTTLFSDRVSAVFAWSQPLVGVARDISLTALDVVLPAKSWFVRQAAGLSGDDPRW